MVFVRYPFACGSYGSCAVATTRMRVADSFTSNLLMSELAVLLPARSIPNVEI